MAATFTTQYDRFKITKPFHPKGRVTVGRTGAFPGRVGRNMPKRKVDCCDDYSVVAPRKNVAARRNEQDSLSHVLFDCSSGGGTKIRVLSCDTDASAVREATSRTKDPGLLESTGSLLQNSSLFYDVSRVDDAIYDIKEDFNLKEHPEDEDVSTEDKDEEKDQHSCGTYLQSLTAQQAHDMMRDFEMYMAKKNVQKEVKEECNESITEELAEAVCCVDFNLILQNLLYGEDGFQPSYDILDILRKELF
jgi:hypothetical protein